MAVRLSSLNELKDFLRVPRAETSLDALLTVFLEGISDECEGETGRVFTKAAYSNEPHRGGSSAVIVKYFPIDLTQTLQVKDFDGTSTTVLDPADYFADGLTGIVRLLGGLRFSPGPKAAQVSYSGGYDTTGTGDDLKTGVPARLSVSVRRLAAARFKHQQGAISAKDLADEEAAARKVWAFFNAGV